MLCKKPKESTTRASTLPRNNGHQKWFGQDYQSPKCYIPHGAVSFRIVGHPFQNRLSTSMPSKLWLIVAGRCAKLFSIMYRYMTLYLINDTLTTGLLAPGSSRMFSSSGISKKISRFRKKETRRKQGWWERKWSMCTNISSNRYHKKTNLHNHQWRT